MTENSDKIQSMDNKKIQNHVADRILSQKLSSKEDYTNDIENFLQVIGFSKILSENGAQKRSGIPAETTIRDIPVTRFN